MGQNTSIRREWDDCKKLVYFFNIHNSLAITTPDMEEILQKLNYDFKKQALEQKNKQFLSLSFVHLLKRTPSSII